VEKYRNPRATEGESICIIFNTTITTSKDVLFEQTLKYGKQKN
jgi:hypothetical protein